MARPCWSCAPEKSWRPSWSGRIEPWLRHWFERPWRGMIRTLHEGLLADGIAVLLPKLCG